MGIETFRIFCDVVHYQSFSRGAALNNVSQSAATQSIHRLEKELGVTLLDRSKRPFILSPDGQICYESMSQIVEAYDNMLVKLQALHNEVGGLIRVAAIYSVGLHDMSRCMGDFMKEHPQANIRLEFQHPHKVYQAVLNGDVDLGVISYPVASPDLTIVPLRSEKMVVVVPKQHPLTQKKELSLEDLQEVDYIAFDNDLIIRKETDRWMKQRNVRVHIRMEFDNIETIKQAVGAGLGVSILPAPTIADDLIFGKLVAIPLVSPQLTRPIGIIHKQKKILTPTMFKFIETLESALNRDDTVNL